MNPENALPKCWEYIAMSNAQKPFETLTPEENAAVNKKKKNTKDEGIALVPVPDDVALAIPKHPLGIPANVWEYRDAENKLLLCACRFITKEGKKEPRPLTYRQYKDGKKKWAWKGVEAPRPLYGLDRMAARPDASILICEGEKATDAAQILFPDYVAITSMNGAESPHRADWNPLQGREITIWRDNDDAGKQYADAVARLALDAGALSVHIVQVPDDTFTEGWDLADTMPGSMEFSTLQAMLDSAAPYELQEESHDYESLKIRAEALTKDSHPDEINALVTDMSDLGAIYRQMLMRIIRKKTGVTMESQKRALHENEESAEPDHLDLARAVISDVGAENLLSTVAHVWMWADCGTWKAIPDRKIKQHAQVVIRTEGEAVSRGLVDGVTDVLKTEIFDPPPIMESRLNSESAIHNGHIIRRKDGKKVPHDRADYRAFAAGRGDAVAGQEAGVRAA
jgi:hypothetical protein